MGIEDNYPLAVLFSALFAALALVLLGKVKNWIWRLLLSIVALGATALFMSLILLPAGWSFLIAAVICVVVGASSWRLRDGGNRVTSIVLFALAIVFLIAAIYSLGGSNIANTVWDSIVTFFQAMVGLIASAFTQVNDGS